MGVTTRNGTVVGGLGASLLEASNAVGVGLVATADCDPGTGVAAREWIGVGGIVGWVASDCNPGTGVAAREGIGVVSAEGASSQSKSNMFSPRPCGCGTTRPSISSPWELVR